MWKLLAPALFIVGCLSKDPRAIPSSASDPPPQSRAVPPHVVHPSPKFFVKSQGGGLATMKTTIHPGADNKKMDVTVSWENAPERELHAQDWIGAFDRNLLSEFHAPVKFKYVFPYGAKWPNLKPYGALNFTLRNFRAPYVFIYISGNQQYPQIIAQSDPVNFESIDEPMGVHVALSPTDPTKMLVMWNQNAPANPTVKWGLTADNLDKHVLASKDTYRKTDFCDTLTSPASRQGWFKPGLLLTAELPDMKPGTTYHYQLGDAVDDGSLSHPSEIFNFTTPPTSKDPTRLIILADMGNAPTDGSMQHSWDFGNRGELPSRNTTRLAKRLLNKNHAHAVVHIGDIAYSVGYLSEWDEFMHQIQPVASRVPWMASIGNHEMGYSESDAFNGTLATSMDSGGECGVAFLKRFPYAMQPLKNRQAWRTADAWYSFNVGPVHFTMLSSEHNFAKGSPQWNWMSNDLKNVDRKVTPWLAVTTHRPMYVGSNWTGDVDVMNLLRDNLEEELIKYDVDFFFTGHHHSYQRWCRMVGGKCADEKNGEKGIYHFVMGMAGYDHSQITPNPALLVSDAKSWGSTYWEFNETTATMQFIDGATDQVIDSFTYHKDAVKKAEKDSVVVI